jgi:multiple sugar transport system ATP-binding protein
VVLGVRPEDLGTAEAGLAVEVDLVEEIGPDAYVYGRTLAPDVPGDRVAPGPGQAVDAAGDVEVVVRTAGRRHPAVGEVVHLAPPAGRVHLFDVTGRRLDAADPADVGTPVPA